ncbi:hypothetical protein CKO25_02165 [Thiocapsa imhoffii]|uniref:YecA family protein n=1 Tax=Thiocapsa imhoffii TaxID=382777 RepID=A0A9X0WFS0_9GAMM|nr:YecA family protein [Thiocapsa imhoffii]MBK1643479.1 hypothetical protein [Thiocapsa imhoffii]
MTRIDPERFARALSESELCPTPSEAHGILCALFCGGDLEPEVTWTGLLIARVPDRDLLAAEKQATLAEVAREVRAAFEEPDLGLTLYTVGEDRPLAERASALYDWTRGFLFGWALLEEKGTTTSPVIREVLHDFAEITRMDLDQLIEDEQHEEALTEVTEFIRVAAMLIHQEQVAVNTDASPP